VINLQWPEDPKAARSQLVQALDRFVTPSSEGCVRFVLQKCAGEWRPVFGRLDVASVGLVDVPACEDLGAVRVVAEKVPAQEFLRRMLLALEGEPFAVAGEYVPFHGMENGFSAIRRYSAESPDAGIQWPAVELQSRHKLEFGREIRTPIKSRSSHALFANLDDVIRHVSAFRRYHGTSDARRNRINLHFWDERARITSVEIQGQRLIVGSEVTDPSQVEIFATITMRPGEPEIVRRIEPDPGFEVPLDTEPFEAKVVLQIGDEESVDERWVRRMTETKADDSGCLIEAVTKIVERFPRTLAALTNRRQGRGAYQISDEQDVQDLLHAVLVSTFDEVEREVTTLKFAGGSDRIDFLLTKEEVGIEVKFVREKRTFRDIREEMFGDITAYFAHPKCKSLVVFVYDPGRLIENPDGVRRDLEAQKLGRLHVRIVS